MAGPVHAETQNGTATSSSTVASASMGAGSADSGYLARVAIRSNVAVSSVAGGETIQFAHRNWWGKP